jgi:esterase/lipase superfamily enzyme
MGAAAGALVFVAVIASGSVDQVNQALKEIGFDPDRAQLIAGLLIGAVVAAASILAGSRTPGASLLGCLVAAVIFGPTFVRETQAAAASTGETGVFDPAGWLITVLALLVSGIVAGWAGAALGSAARPSLAEAIRSSRMSVGGRRIEIGAPRRVAGIALVALMLAVTLPIFGDIVNYAPDSRMLHGRPPLAGLGGPASTDLPTVPPASTTPDVSAGESASISPGPSWSPTPSPKAVDQRPWLAWRPSGVGQVINATLPGPWKGYPPTADITIYTPPGYSSHGSRRYPVLYQAPYTFSHWDAATNISGALDTLINKGAMPPVIVVSMSTQGGPYTDSECTNSYDGREWFDTYVAETAVNWVDSHFLTIPEPSARAILGASQGGYCAAALGSRHPEVFSTTLVFSGYFHAGGVGPPSNLPFGTDKAFIDAASPDVVIFNIPPAARLHMYFRLVALPGQTIYGPEATRFDGLLDTAGIPHTLINSTVPHGWAQLRIEFPAAMDDWAAHMVAAGVF